jgi:MFS family permease
MWLLLFFGGSIVPGLTGIMISSTPEKTKEIANSITHLCYNLLGYLPSPLLYGLVCKYTGGVTSRYGLAFILCWSYFGVFFLYLAKYFKDNAYSMQINPEIRFSNPSDDYEENEKKLEDQAGALTAIYGRVSNIK